MSIKLVERPVSPLTPTRTAPLADSPLIRQATARVEALTAFTLDQYNIEPEHMRLIASCLLDTRQIPTWLVAETQRTPFWNHLNFAIKALGMFPLYNVSGLRMPRMSGIMADRWLKEWMGDRHEHPRIFIDTQCLYDRSYMRRITAKHPYLAVMAECVRAVIPVMMLRVPDDGAEEEFLRLLRMVLQRPSITGQLLLPEPIVPSPALLDVIHMLPVANPELEDSEVLFTTICMLPGAHAALYGRTIHQLTDTDFENMMLVLRGSIRQWAKTIILPIYLIAAKPGGVWTCTTEMRERTGIERHAVLERMDRLHQQGILKCRKIKSRFHYSLTPDGALAGAILYSSNGGSWKVW